MLSILTQIEELVRWQFTLAEQTYVRVNVKFSINESPYWRGKTRWYCISTVRTILQSKELHTSELILTVRGL